MSYQVLARKWRPQRFSEVVGQQHVLSALENGLGENRLHHAYLFSGTRGVGKTSIARLFAKGLNCENGITANPCGQCANCKAIEEGRFIDLIEIDAASRTKVEDTRELLDNVQYKPTVGRFKVYLIDEVHMLSRHSFNALLKTLEEPPEYVKFLLATTDPQKLPITILSRCMQFHLRALDQSQIQHHLEFILNQEHIAYESAALAKLAKAAQGSVRDALSLTDQAIAVSNANLSLSAVSQMLGLIDDHQPIELVQALAAADGEKAMAVIQSVAEKGVDWQQLLSDAAEVLHKIALLQLLKQPQQDDSALQFLAKQIAPEDVQFFYQILLTGKKELPFAPEQRSGVEMTILRALAFHPQNMANFTPAVAPSQPPQAAQHTERNIAQLRERLTQQQAQALSTVPTAPNMMATTVDSPNSEQKPLTEQKQTAEQKQVAKPQPSIAPQVESQTPPAETEPSAALLALNARKQLKAKQEAAQSEIEKKKPELAAPTQTQTPATSTSTAPKTKTTKPNLQQRLASLVTIAPSENSQNKVAASEPQSEEDYRWTWLNPELETEQEVAKPSDIKQAILQERTPELVRKTIELSCQQDEWSDLVNRLKLGGLSRQLALNSYLAEKQQNQLHLVLKPSMAHLNSDDSRQSLSTALAEQGFNFQLSVGESETHQTPLELRRAIFENLTIEAKNALLADEKLQLLRQAFDAQIDESTIRAVAE